MNFKYWFCEIIINYLFVALMAHPKPAAFTNLWMWFSVYQILLNEVAPRPHNSGHHTIESCYTSQFEQHLRAVVGLPLGDPSMKTPAAIMYNLLGEDEVNFSSFFSFFFFPCPIPFLPSLSFFIYLFICLTVSFACNAKDKENKGDSKSFWN